MGFSKFSSNSNPRRILGILALLVFSLPANASIIISRNLEAHQLSSDVSLSNNIPNSALSIQCQTTTTTVNIDAVVKALEYFSNTGGAVWRLDNEGIAGIDGMPDLPAISRWVAVPSTGELSLEVSVRDRVCQIGQSPARFRDQEDSDGREDGIVEDIHGVWPPEPAKISEPMIWRGIRLVNLVLYPVQWDADAGEYILNEGITTEIVRVDERGINEVVPGYREPCRDFDRAVRSLVVNPPVRDDGEEEYLPGSYLVVANEDYPDAVDFFIEWKRESGHKVELLTFDPLVTDRIQLKAAIREIYEESHFSFLVLMGNEEADPPIQIPYDDEFYDNYFGQLEGLDPIADVAVGTYNCQTVENFNCAILRTIAYEKDPDTENTDWFSKAFVGVGHCSVPADLSPSYSGKWVQAVLERKGFEVASTYYSDNEDNDFSPDVADQYNDGVNMIIVRGHQTDFEEDEIGRRGVYPFHFMVSSSTISPGGWGGSFNRTFRLGTPDDMRGPSAGFGHYPSPRTNMANAIVGGLAEALFHKDIRSFGWARTYLTAKLPIVMPADQGQTVTRYWGTLRYYGDPGQEPWIGVPREVEVDYEELNIGASGYRVRVHIGEEPVAGAVVTLYDPDNLHEIRLTDDDGFADFAWDNPGFDHFQPTLTITGEGILPWQDHLDPIGEIVMVVTDYRITDTNGSEEINPGDEIALIATFQNRGGNDPSEPFDIEFQCISPYLSGSFQAAHVPELRIGEEVEVEFLPTEDNPPRVLSSTPNGIRIDGIIPVEPNKGVYFQVTAPQLVLDQIDINDPEPAPGDIVAFGLTLINTGGCTAENVRGTLRAVSEYARVMDRAGSWNDIGVDEVVEQSDEFSFVIENSAIRGNTIYLEVEFENGVWSGMTLPLEIEMTGRNVSDPIGPDHYGYIGLEDGDNDIEWADAPEFRWINISPWGGEFQGTLLNFPVQGGEDSSLVIDLPFNFRYYGSEYQQITVCNNGWIAVGEQIGLKNQQNWPLPGYNGAWGMIAPFWDRLEMRTRSDGVFSYYDEQGHKFILQWQTGVLDDATNWFPNAFQVILFDPEFYETPTLDSPFLFQYHTVNDQQGDFEANFHCSVGISSPDGEDGLTYVYWGLTPDGSRNIINNRAILWTPIAWEPRAILEGRIVRYIDSTAVPGAYVDLSNGQQVFSHNEGDYRFASLPANDLWVSARAKGYGDTEIGGIDLVAGEVTRQDLVLPHGWFEIPEDTIFIRSPNDRDNWAWGEVMFDNIGNLPTKASFELIIPDSALWSDSLTLSFEEGFDTVDVPVGRTWVDINVYGNISGVFSAILRISSDTPTGVIDRPMNVTIWAEVNHRADLPLTFSLAKPYPNPFNSQTMIRFDTPVAGNVELVLTDLLGRRIKLLTNGRVSAGSHSMVLNADDLPTGLYLIRMEADEFRSTQRLLLLR